MIVFSKRNIVIPGPDGQKFLLKKAGIGPVPVWAEKSAYLMALASVGKFGITEESKKPRKPSEDEK